MKQNAIVLKVLQTAYPAWVPSHALTKVSTPWGSLGTAAPVRAREMARAGTIERKEEGKFVWFRYKRNELGSPTLVKPQPVQERLGIHLAPIRE